jgi:hypothetical protein
LINIVTVLVPEGKQPFEKASLKYDPKATSYEEKNDHFIYKNESKVDKR